MDDKDQRFPLELKRLIADSPVKQVFQKIFELSEDKDTSALVFMGDLTDYGGLEGYKACAKYIARSLQVGAHGQRPSLPIGIVPGNHDIDRQLAKDPSTTAKFGPLLAALTAEGLPSIPVESPVWLPVATGGLSTKIALMNSCWGCGSKEFIPEEFRDDVQEAIDKAIARGNTPQKQVAAYYDRQFDTPAFSVEAVSKLVSATPDVAECGLLVVVAHHNLLPQRQPRLAPYTELVNSGALRGALQELDRPVIYMHGHIHQDPVEIIQSPGGSVVLSISAPEIRSGFNIVEIVHTRSQIPLSCRITKWRFDQGGYLKKQAPINVSLIGNRRRSQDGSLASLYSVLLRVREVYWSQLVKEMTPIYTVDVEQQLEEHLELLSADGRVTIDNYDRPTINWIVGAHI